MKLLIVLILCFSYNIALAKTADNFDCSKVPQANIDYGEGFIEEPHEAFVEHRCNRWDKGAWTNEGDMVLYRNINYCPQCGKKIKNADRQ